MSADSVLVFTILSFLFAFSPGPAVLLVAAFGLRSGMRAALGANLGILAGNTVYMLLVAFGLGALVSTSPTAFLVLKASGAIYLIYLGVRAMMTAGNDEDGQAEHPERGPFLQALIVQLTNPKAMLFFGALAPQFVNPQAPLAPQYLIIGAISLVSDLIALSVYGWIAAQGRRVASPSWDIWRERLSGLCLIVVGCLFAFSSLG